MKAEGSACVFNSNETVSALFRLIIGSYGTLVILPAALIVASNFVVFVFLRVKKTKLASKAKAALYMISAASIISLSLLLIAGWAITNDYVPSEESSYRQVIFLQNSQNYSVI